MGAKQMQHIKMGSNFSLTVKESLTVISIKKGGQLILSLVSQSPKMEQKKSPFNICLLDTPTASSVENGGKFWERRKWCLAFDKKEKEQVTGEMESDT